MKRDNKEREAILVIADGIHARGKSPLDRTNWADAESYEKYIVFLSSPPGPKTATGPDLSPEAPVETNAAGGQQSNTGCLLLETPRALLHVGGVFAHGASKYARGNWRLIPVEDHINHVLVHLMAHLAGDEQDDHLGHALCRMLMAVELAPTDSGE